MGEEGDARRIVGGLFSWVVDSSEIIGERGAVQEGQPPGSPSSCADGWSKGGWSVGGGRWSRKTRSGAKFGSNDSEACLTASRTGGKEVDAQGGGRRKRKVRHSMGVVTRERVFNYGDDWMEEGGSARRWATKTGEEAVWEGRRLGTVSGWVDDGRVCSWEGAEWGGRRKRSGCCFSVLSVACVCRSARG